MLNPLFDLNHPGASLRGFGDLARLMGEVNHWFDGLVDGPEVNVYTNDEGAVIHMAVPGYDPQKLSIEADNDALVISYSDADADQAKDQAEDQDRQYQVLRQEIAYGSFTRRIQLPFTVDGDHTEARYENGVLTVAVAKPSNERPRRIAISS